MARHLKVYGWTGLNPNPRNGQVKGAQARVICAAHSVSELLRVTGIRRSEYQWSGCETGNEAEISQAMSQPLTAFYRGLDARDGEWFNYKEQS